MEYSGSVTAKEIIEMSVRRKKGQNPQRIASLK